MLPGVKQPPIKFGDLMVYLTVAIKHIRMMMLLMCLSIVGGLTLYVYARPVYYSKTLIERKDLPLPVTAESVFGDASINALFFQFNSPHLTERTAKHFGIDMPDKYIRRKYLRKTTFRVNSQGNIEAEVWAYSRDMAEFWTQRILEEYFTYRAEQRQKRRDLVMNDYSKQMEQISKKMEAWLNTTYDYQDSNKIAAATIQLKEMQGVPLQLVRVNHMVFELKELQSRLKKPDLGLIEKLSVLGSYGWLLDMKVGDTFNMSANDPQANEGVLDANGILKSKEREVVIVPQMTERATEVAWLNTEREYRRMLQDRAELTKKYLPAHPKMKAFETKLQELEAKLNSDLESGINQVQVRIDELTARQKTLNDKLPEYLEAQKQQSKLKMGFDQMAAGQLAWRSWYDQMAKAISLLEFGEDKERVYLNYAGPLEEHLDTPASPNRLNIMIYSLAFGIVLALGIPFLIEYLDHTIGTVEVGEDSLKLRALGVVPQIKQGSATDAVATDSDTATMTENFRVIRTNLLFNSEKHNDCRVIMVASAMPQEGKTYVARHIAISFARKAERTLLIDADVRRGTVHQAFNAASSPGLAEIILGKVNSEDAIRKTDIPNLDVIPRGKFSEEVTDRFAGEGFQKFLADMRTKYERVIIDTPPVLGLAETSSLLPFVDGVVFVVWSGRTPLRNVRIAIETLRSNRAKFLGFVLNRLDLSATSNYYYYYYYSHNYYENYQPAERSSGS